MRCVAAYSTLSTVVPKRVLAEESSVRATESLASSCWPADSASRNAATRAATSASSIVEDEAAMTEAFRDSMPDVVVHLAAQAGVRYSLEHPREYISSNIVGSFNVIELARQQRSVGVADEVLALPSLESELGLELDFFIPEEA